MEYSCSVLFVLCLVAFFGTLTRARSLSGESRDPRQSAKYKAMEARFLKMLGMTKAPRVRRDAVVPQYMLDLYHSRVKDEDYISTNLVFKDFATTANTVRSFYHKDVPHKSDRVRRSTRHVYVDIGRVPSHEELVRAEFRIYNNRNASALRGLHTINIYQIIAPGAERKLLASRVVNTSAAGWQSYDILAAVKHWHQTPGENRGLQVDIMDANGNPIDISHLNFEAPHERDEQWPHLRPLLALFSHDPNTHYHKKRVRRGAGKKKEESYINYKGLCKNLPLRVDFVQNLTWNWVVQPEVLDVRICTGRCEYPMPSHMNATNHAVVQTLVHSVKKNRVPPACCVPIELESTLMLFMTDNAVDLKDYPDMVVESCGCR